MVTAQEMNGRTDTREQPVRTREPATTRFPRSITGLFRREPDRYSLKDDHSVIILWLAIALHAAVVIGFTRYQSTPVIRFQAPRPMMVTMVRPPEPLKAEVVPVPQPPAPAPPPKPKPIVKKKPVPKPKPKPKAIHIRARQEPTPPPPPVAPATRAQKGPRTDVPPEPTPPIFSADYLNNPAPSYPAISRRLGEKGRVLLKVLVSPQGRADQVRVHRSSGYNRLDTVARDAVTHWTFVPAKLGALPVRAWVIVPILFTLRG